MKISQLIFRGETYCFLAGAGVSFNPPSNLPVARTIVFGLLDALNIDEAYRTEFKGKFDSAELRFEQFIEQVVRNYSDHELEVFKDLSSCKSPNRLHHFLANCIARNHPTFTTNFEDLIEQAGRANGIQIEAIYDEESLQAKKGKIALPLYKLHGTFVDEQGIDRKYSVATMVSSIGKIGEGFSLNVAFRELLTEAVHSATLIVLGYSGYDDYDILPALAQIHSPKQLLWIHHSWNTPEPEIYTGSEWDKLPDHLRHVLEDLISMGEWEKDRILVVVGETAKIIAEIEKILLPDSPAYSPGPPYQIPSYFYEDWKFEHALEAWRNEALVAGICESLGEYERAARHLESALLSVEAIDDRGADVHLRLDLSELYLRMNKPGAAKTHLDQLARLTEKIDLPLDLKVLLDQYEATCYAETGNLSKAEEIFNRSSVGQNDPVYAGNLFELSRVATLQGDPVRARALVEEALVIYRRAGKLNSIVYCLNQLAEDDIENERYREALNSILEAVRICNLTKNFALLSRCYKIRSRLYSHIGLIGKAFEDLRSALEIIDTRLKDIHDKACCYASMAMLLKRTESIRESVSGNKSCKMSGHYVEGLGSFYTPSDMPDLFKGNASLEDGYVVSGGKKIAGLKSDFMGFFPTTEQHSLCEDTSRGLILADEFPDETLSSKEYADLALKTAGESGEKALLEEVEKILSRKGGQDQ